MPASFLLGAAHNPFSLAKGEVLPVDDSQASKQTEASTTTTISSSGEMMRSVDDVDDDEIVEEEESRATALREPPSSNTKNVSFGLVRLHSHNVILGDNPSVSKGPPVSLDWKVVASDRVDLDEYELAKLIRCYETDDTCDDNNNTVTKRPSRIPVEERYQMVRAAGHSRGSLLRVDAEIRAIKKQQLTAGATAEKEEVRRSHPAPFFLRWIANRRAKKNGGKPREPSSNRCA